MQPLAVTSKHLKESIGSVPTEYLLVLTGIQRMALVAGGNVILEYDVSTARAGTGCEEGSMKTPLGVHRICAKIGEGAPLWRVFVGREDTGKEWDRNDRSENAILTRILWLEGLEDGVNRGPGIDTRERYIYLHGTNREDAVGNTPVSHGCILMRNAEIVELFSRVEVGTIVVIH